MAVVVAVVVLVVFVVVVRTSSLPRRGICGGSGFYNEILIYYVE